MLKSYTYSDIFTEFDDSIFAEGSIDPLGLRMIWTNLGNNIFENRLNTISTDIRYYTINLFHHFIIQKCKTQNNDAFINLVSSSSEFNNNTDLYDALIIFLESLLIHACADADDNSSDYAIVPGISKYKGLARNEPNSDKVKKIFANREKGLLVRHILLGIHGRHKGPFQQMNILGKPDYYSNSKVWQEAEEIFKHKPWAELSKLLTELISNNILEKKQTVFNAEEILTDNIKSLILEILKPAIFKEEPIINYWEENLNLKSDAAGLLYKELKKASDKTDFEKIIKNAAENSTREKTELINAIVNIEPVLAAADKIFSLLMHRGRNKIDDQLREITENQIHTFSANAEKINHYKDIFLSNESKKRLHKILDICLSNEPTDNKIKGLIAYHTQLIESRGSITWVKINDNNEITQNRSFTYTEKEIESFKNYEWINNYYIKTLHSIYKGLYSEQ